MKITLYTKPDCCLCDNVKADLTLLRQRFDFELHERNIEEDAADFERYRYLIPVVDIEEGAMLYAPITQADLFQALNQVNVPA